MVKNFYYAFTLIKMNIFVADMPTHYQHNIDKKTKKIFYIPAEGVILKYCCSNRPQLDQIRVV